MIQLSIREYHIYIVSEKMNIERIRQMARELNVDMVNKGINCLPKDNRKYAGSVTRVNKDGGNVAWVLKVSFVSY